MSNLLTADESSFPNPKPRAALVAYKAFADTAGKASLFLVTIVAARRLSAHGFGVFSIGSASGWMAVVAADFGIQMHLARAVARRPDAAERLLRTWLRVRCWTAAAALVAVTAALAVLRTPLETAGPIFVLSVVYAVSGLLELLHHFYRGLSRTDIESSLILWQRLGTLVCGLAALALRPTVGTLALAMLVPVVVSLAVSLRIAEKTQRTQRTHRTHRTPREDSRQHRATVRTEFFRDVAPIGAGIVLSALYFRIDVLLVQLWAGTELVARYNAVFRLVEALRLFPAAVLAVVLPVLCRAADWRPLFRVATSVTLFALAATLPLWWLADTIVPLIYGPAYAAATPAFRVLLLSFPLMSLNYALTHQLIAWDGQRAYAVTCGAALIANVVLNARLIPAMSIAGAAWATLGTEAVVTVGCLVGLAARTTGRVDLTDDARIARPAIADGALT